MWRKLPADKKRVNITQPQSTNLRKKKSSRRRHDSLPFFDALKLFCISILLSHNRFYDHKIAHIQNIQQNLSDENFLSFLGFYGCFISFILYFIGRSIRPIFEI